ncbi:rod shape-determining protein MreC [Kushneria phosphatilytica]|uniref:Cell shape-determining protein MreC n=2 Tax=Kushneria phosphatilytica TaxID=657387 RepID=A0A1S1NXS7_9GAMM|nr:rod shape-determining protein MreC [Kushneria phosphatilytica]QEL11468.1 rod shape-determining protein MreC [Kushneria phosphatilytica]
MLLCAFLALMLLYADHRFDWMDGVRGHAATVTTPIQWVVSLPSRGLNWASRIVSSQSELIEENRQLHRQLLTLSQRVQRMASLSAENVRLRQLLHATPRQNIPWMTAELMTLDNDPFLHQMVVDRGRVDGAYIGQPVVDASGLVGQVTSVSRYTSRVLLITDASHAVPVQINRNGLRFIAQGAGQSNTLNVMNVPNNTDIREGDLLVTSGMADRFPEGYPVARVSEVRRNPGGPFAHVEAAPIARLDRSRQFLMLFARSVPKRQHEQLDPAAVSIALQIIQPSTDHSGGSDGRSP